MLHLLQPLAIFGGRGGGGTTFRHPDPRSLSLHNFAISTLVLYLGILSPSRIFHSLRQICRPPAAVPSLSPLLPVVLEHVIGHWVLSAGDAWRTMRLAPTTILKSAYDSISGNVLVCSRLYPVFLEPCIKNRRNSHVRVILYLHYLYIIIIIISPRQNTHIE